MATGPGVNQGKTAFLEEFLPGNRDADVEAVNRAWAEAGKEGTISESLINKLRSKLGLTGRRGDGESGAGRPRKARPSGKKPGRPVGRPRRSADGPQARAGADAATRPGDEEDALDDLEEGIDELIQKVRELGGRPDVVKALRRARRLLVRGLEE